MSTTVAPWESFVTPKMLADAERQSVKLVNGGMSVTAAAAEAAAWVRVRAINARMISSLPR